MCGIAGCFGKKDEATINLMLEALAHRGPNDRGVHSGDNMAWGHTRLSVVDVAHGHQPLLSEDNSKGLIVEPQGDKIIAAFISRERL